MKSLNRVTAAALAGLIAVLSGAGSTQTPIRANAAVDETTLNNAEIVVCTINDIRAANGLPELAIVPLLIEVSDLRASEIVEKYDHVRPDGTTCFTALRSEGFMYSYAGENIAAGHYDPVATVNGWMNSELHRNTILSESYTHIGVGYEYAENSEYRHYWSMFAIGVYDGSAPHVYDGQYIPERELGDANGTKVINADDANAILSYSAAVSAGVGYGVTDGFKSAADVNGDGRINAVDASSILTYSAARGSGKDVTLKDYIW